MNKKKSNLIKKTLKNMQNVIAFLLLISVIGLLVVVCIGPYDRVCTDISSPLNFVLHQEPNAQYSHQFVNLWVPKSWRSDETKIPCRLDKFSESDTNLIIYSHSNFENLLSITEFTRTLSQTLKCSVLSYDYSGYGLNKYDGFERSADGINTTLTTIYNYAIQKQKFESSNVILMGYSFGTGCTLQVAVEVGHIKGIVLVAAFTSILDIVKDQVSKKLGNNTGTKITSMFKERWNNIKNISKAKAPILLIHGKHDQMVDIKSAHKLKQMDGNITLVETEGGHTSFKWDDLSNIINHWISI